MTSFCRDGLTGLPAEMGLAARQLWRAGGLAPADIDTAVPYDRVTPSC